MFLFFYQFFIVVSICFDFPKMFMNPTVLTASRSRHFLDIATLDNRPSLRIIVLHYNKVCSCTLISTSDTSFKCTQYTLA
jgi:hypothetical protein